MIYEILKRIDAVIRPVLEFGSMPAAPIDVMRVASGRATIKKYPRPSFDERISMYGQMKERGIKVGHTHHCPGWKDEIMIMPRVSPPFDAIEMMPNRPNVLRLWRKR